MKFNNVEMPSWFRIIDIYGRGITSRNLDLVTVPGMHGAHLNEVITPPKYLEIKVRIDAKDKLELSERIDEINAILDVQEPVPIVFPDEPNWTYYGIPEITSDEGRKTFFARDTITIVCPDPYKYGPEKSVIFPSDVVAYSYKGSAEAFPIYEMTVTAPITFAMIQNHLEESMLIGKPVDVDTEQVDSKQTIIDERGETLNQWDSPPIKIDSHTALISGELGTDSTGIVPINYGSGDKWHGPARAIEINPIQDFEVEMFCRVELTRPSDTFRIETYLFDENLKVIGKIAIVDSTINNNQIAAEGRYGDFKGNNEDYLISSRNYIRRANHFHGLVRVTRQGNQFVFYVARLGSGDIPIHHDTLSVPINVTDGNLLGKLKYVQIHFGKFGSSTSATVPRINRLKVTELKEVTVDQTPYIAYPGDIITLDTQTEEMLINGEDVMEHKDFISEFFSLKKGENTLAVLPEDSLDVKMRYRERRK